MRILVALLLLCQVAIGKDFILQWEASDTPGVTYRIWMSTGEVYSVMAETTALSMPISIPPSFRSFYVTATLTNAESEPSNTFNIPPPAGIVGGVSITTNQPLANIFMEAESGAIGTPMSTVFMTDASGGTAVLSTTANLGEVTFQISVDAGVYVVWCRLKAVDSGQDSLFVSMDGLEDAFGNEANLSPDFQWAKVNSANGAGPVRTFSLSHGMHTLRFRAREPGVPLDAIYVTKDMSFVPP